MVALRAVSFWFFSLLLLGQVLAHAQEVSSKSVGKPARSSITIAQRLPPPEMVSASIQGDGLFADHQQLSITDFVDSAVLRNQSVEALVNAWRAAAQRYPQVVSLDDPMFMAMVAPASLGSSNVESAYVLQGSQKFQWNGKRAAKGRAASAEASAMLGEVRDAKLEVTRMAQAAYYDYFLVYQEIALTKQNAGSIAEFRKTAQTKYENNLATEQDVLQADIELIEVERRQLELERMKRVSVARINTLLLRTPNDYLPSPANELSFPAELPPVVTLRQVAVGQRPDLAAVAGRMRAEQANLTLATKQYYPDADVFGRYDSFWQPVATQSDLRGQVGVNVNVPIYHRRLAAGVCEAQFRVAQRQAEYQQKVADIQYEVEAAYAQVVEASKAVQLYEKKFLPIAERNVSAARTNYDVGKLSFLDLIRAQRQRIELRDRHQVSIADLHRRLADLERATGGPISELLDQQSEELPTNHR